MDPFEFRGCQTLRFGAFFFELIGSPRARAHPPQQNG
jgi:hypothetical protein